MKLITAIVTPAEFQAIKQALSIFGVTGMTITEVYQRDITGRDQIYRGQRFRTDLAPHVRIDLVTTDHDLADLIHIITKLAPRRGCAESIWITAVETLIRIRTGERGTDAL
jgi:nitrogen regulatory protein P-II 1